MTISDATPIQFWLNGEQTFNQANPICGLTDACFCQIFNCGDEIRIQFQDEDIQAAILLITAESGEEFSLNFSKINDTTFQLSFVPSELGLCGEQVRFSITDGVDTLLAPTSWVNTYAANSLNKSATQFTQAVVTGTNWGNDQPLPTQVALGGVVSFDVIIGITGTWTGQVNIAFRITRSGGSETAVYSINLTANQSPTVHHIVLTKSIAQSLPEDLTLLVDGTSTGTANVTITIPVGDIIYTGEILASSDCIDLRNNHQCTKLIEYSNSDDFDGIAYNISPQPTFYLRVPAQLLEDENPQTQEDLELSNGVIVTVRQTIQEKSIFKLGFMPPYMHTKVQKVLMHDTVIIDDQQWKRRDAYEAPRVENYPLKKGEVLLTKYNSVLKNTI